MPIHFGGDGEMLCTDSFWPFRSLVLSTQKLKSASVKKPELSKVMFSLINPGVGQTITKRMLRPQPDSTKVLRMRLNRGPPYVSIHMQKDDIIITDRFYIVLFSTLKQTQCTRMRFYMSE